MLSIPHSETRVGNQAHNAVLAACLRRDTWSEDIAALMTEADRAMHDLNVKQLSHPTSACSQLC